MPDYTETSNFGLKLPKLNKLLYHTLLNRNFQTIDVLLGRYITVLNLKGVWENLFDYSIGDTVIDETTSSVYVCAVGHRSAASPTTFAGDRANHPTFWTLDELDTNAALIALEGDITNLESSLGAIAPMNTYSGFTCLATTTNATPLNATLTTFGNAVIGTQIQLAENSASYLYTQLAAYNVAASKVWSRIFCTLVKRNATTLSIVGTTTLTQLIDPELANVAAAWTLGPNGAHLTLTGIAATTLSWSGCVRANSKVFLSP